MGCQGTLAVFRDKIDKPKFLKQTTGKLRRPTRCYTSFRMLSKYQQ
jgi:hypothetical protein